MPVAITQLLLADGIEWIDQLVVRSGCSGLTNYQEADVLLRIIDEGMTNARAARERHAIAWIQPVNLTIDPDVWIAFDHIDKLIDVTLCMGPGGSAARRQQIMVDSNAGQPHLATKGSGDAQ